MDNRFRKIVVQQIEDLVKQEPSAETLLKLLQIAKPEFSEADLANERKRESAYRALKQLVHPDKHPSDCAGAVAPVFQAVQSFYDNCQAQGNIKKRKRTSVSPTSVKFPFQFHVKDQWKFLKVVHPTMPSSVVDHGLIARLIAYKCINFRGAIAHKKSTELVYGSKQMSQPTFVQ